MKTWKKALAGLTAMAICSGASVALNAAYLTDRDSEANVFTVGDVTIDLVEEKFESGATLLPGVTIDKEAHIVNTGSNDAWVWMTIAVPSALDNAGDASQNVLHWNVPGAFWEGYNDMQKYIDSAIENGWLPAGSTGVESAYTWDVGTAVPMRTEEIDGITYNVHTLLYNSALKPGGKTNIGLSDVYMDTRVDIDPDGNWHFVKGGQVTKLDWNSKDNGEPIVYVSAYAMQADANITSVEQAYGLYGEQWGDNGDEWGEPQVKVDADNATTSIIPLQEALNKGLNVELAADIETKNDEDALVGVAFDKNADINLANKTLTTAYIDASSAETTLKNGSLNSGTPSDYGVIAREGAEVTIDNVDVKSAGGGIAAANGAKVIFNSGSVDVNSKSTSGRYLFYAEGVGSEIIINGGSFDFNKTQNQKRAYIFASAGTTVTVNGGTFGKASTRSGYTEGIMGEGTVVIKGGTFGFNPSAWVASGYVATDNGNGTWTVSAQ